MTQERIDQIQAAAIIGACHSAIVGGYWYTGMEKVLAKLKRIEAYIWQREF